MESKVIDICGKRITEYLLQALSWFNNGGDKVILRGIGGDAARAVQIATILQDTFGCEMEDSRIGYFNLEGSKTSYLEISLIWKNDHLYPMNIPYPETGFVDFPIYQLIFEKKLKDNGKLEVYTEKLHIGTIKMINNTLSFTRTIEKTDDKDLYYGLRDALYRAGMLLPANWKEITQILSNYDDVILGIDTNILLNASISEHLIPILHLYNPIDYAHTPNWLLFIIPSTVMYELEEFANIRDEFGKIRRFGRRGFRALQEIIEINESYDLSGISIVIVGETDPVLESRAEIQGLRQDLRAFLKGMDSSKDIHFSPKSSSGDIIIRDQFKNFLRKIDFHKGVYFLTSDKSNAALADAEGLHSLYMKLPAEEFKKDKDKRYEEVKISGEPSVKIGVPVGKLLYELAVEFGQITVEFNHTSVNLEVDMYGEKIDHWIHRRLKINKYEYRTLMYSDGFVDVNKVIDVWNKIMRNKD